MRAGNARRDPPPDAPQDDAPPLLLPGLKPVLELLEREPGRVDMLFIKRGLRTPESMRMLDLCRSASVRFSLADAGTLDALHSGAHQGVIARLLDTARTEFGDLLTQARSAPLPLILALDQVQDTGNLGTLARSLYALGGAGLLVPRHNSAYAGPGAMRASAGALRKLPFSRVANLKRALESAREAGFAVYGASAAPGSLNAWSAELLTPALLVLGNEDKGIRPGVAERCDVLLHIPMCRGFDSLNVAQAGAMLLACFAARASGPVTPPAST